MNWWNEALCAEIGPDIFCQDDGPGTDYTLARQACALCPVSAECLEAALAEEAGTGKDDRYGMRGGKTPTQRWAMERAAA